jgi:hypothetical protein
MPSAVTFPSVMGVMTVMPAPAPLFEFLLFKHVCILQ